jgi:two-component system, NarL family, response regulator DesR
MSIRIVVADQPRLTLEALAATLNLVQDFHVVGAVSEGPQIIPMVMRTMPTVVILGLGVPGAECVAGELRDHVPGCGIALLTAAPNRALVDHAITAGALSVVTRDAKLAHLVDAVRGVAAGCLTIDPGLFCGSGGGCRTLTDRQLEILRRTATGASVKEIASELHLAPGTVRNLTSQSMRKLRGRNRFDTARIASERGLL